MIEKHTYSNSLMDKYKNKDINNILLFSNKEQHNLTSKGLFDHRTNPRAHISSQRN